MTPSTCAFCTHENPVRAKFCNECASPLALRPCRACDAVNPKIATACYRCRAALPVIAASAVVSTETIVAQADETLEELRRELAEATARASGLVPAVRDAPVAAQAAPVESEASQAPAPALERIVADEQGTVPPRGEHFIKLDEGAMAPLTPVEAAADPVPGAGEAETVVLRGRRSSPALAAAVIVVLLALPVGIYAWRNPDQVQTWLTQVAAFLPGARPESAATETSPVAAPTLSSTPGEASVASDAPADAVRPRGDSRDLEQTTSESKATSPPETAPALAAPTAEPPVEAAAALAAPAAKSATTSRPRASTSKSRPRDRATRPRSSSSPATSRRSSPPLESTEPD